MVSLVLVLACTHTVDLDRSAPTESVYRSGTAIEVAVGAVSACSLHEDQTVWCWGRATYGLLGDPAIHDGGISSPVQVVGIHSAVAVSTYQEYACALLDDGDVACWGWNHHLQLGSAVDSGETARQALRVPGVHDVVAFAAGHHHACAVHSDGTSSCWGQPYEFALGDGETWSSSVPVASSGVSDAVSVSAGHEQACVVEADGALYCWGDNYTGVLGVGDRAVRERPTRVSLDPVLDVDIDTYQACAVHEGGGVSCWGRAFDGSSQALSPVRVDWLRDIVEVEVGRGISCALDGVGVLYCWGYDELGERDVPVDLPLGVSTVDVGSRNACAVDEAGEVWCVGGSPYEPVTLELGETGEWVKIPNLPRAG